MAVTVKVAVASAVGAPEITPVSLSRVRPDGRLLPVARLQVIGVVPSAASVALYRVPTVPSDRFVVVIAGVYFTLSPKLLSRLSSSVPPSTITL